MKLFLTSAGLKTTVLQQAFLKFVGKKAPQMNIAYVTTAANAEQDKSYIEKDRADFTDMGIEEVTDIDIATQKKEEILPIFQEADVIWFAGGNTFYLLDQIRKQDVMAYLEPLVKEQGKIFAGESAGSIVATSSIEIAGVEPANENVVGLTDLTGLNFVPFEVSPHSPGIVSLENTRAYANSRDNLVIALDDKSAIEVIDDAISPVGDGVLFL